VKLPLVVSTRSQRDALKWRLRKSERELAKTKVTLEKAKRGELQPGPPIVPVEYEHADIRIVGATRVASKRRLTANKEPFTVEWLHSLPAGEVLYDIGANVGVLSLIAALRPQGAMRVVALEPSAATFAVLCSNLALNEVGDQIVPLPVLLGERTELGRFGYSDLDAGTALHAGGGEEVVRDVVFWQPMLTFALDDLVEQFGLPHPERIKLDVDGAELTVLRGARKLLADPRLKAVFSELNPPVAAAVEELLASHGLHPAGRYRRPDSPASLDHVLFERS
jgi:FkbM family methyltransferase